MWWLSLLLACTPPEPEPDACDVEPVGEVSLPADDAAHDEVVEWWYWTGHLQDAEGRWYGFERAFFLTQIGPYVARHVHSALTDVAADTFDYEVVYEEGSYTETTDGFDLAMAGQTAKGGGGHDTLTGAFDGVGYDLALASTKPVVLQHGDGYHDYPSGGYTYYYSRQRMAANGTVTVDGDVRQVTGEAWFDHQYGNLLSAVTDGWDWFAIQLDDGREIMLFLVNGGEGLIGGSYTDGCETREIDADALTVRSWGTWTSPHTGCTWPMGWDVEVGDLVLFVDPVREDQEVANSYKTYWEGAAEVRGGATGRAYVELTGYCDGWNPDAR